MRIASRPLITGMLLSIRITSGLWLRAISTPARPSVAVSTRQSARSDSASVSSARLARLSSTHRIVVTCGSPPTSSVGVGRRGATLARSTCRRSALRRSIQKVLPAPGVL